MVDELLTPEENPYNPMNSVLERQLHDAFQSGAKAQLAKDEKRFVEEKIEWGLSVHHAAWEHATSAAKEEIAMSNVENLARKAQAKWGHEAQMNMVIEECAELIDTIQKYRRGRVDLKEVLEKGVDVEIMIEQLRVFVEEPVLWNHIRATKLARLQRRLDA